MVQLPAPSDILCRTPGDAGVLSVENAGRGVNTEENGVFAQYLEKLLPEKSDDDSSSETAGSAGKPRKESRNMGLRKSGDELSDTELLLAASQPIRDAVSTAVERIGRRSSDPAVVEKTSEHTARKTGAAQKSHESEPGNGIRRLLKNETAGTGKLQEPGDSGKTTAPDTGGGKVTAEITAMVKTQKDDVSGRIRAGREQDVRKPQGGSVALGPTGDSVHSFVSRKAEVRADHGKADASESAKNGKEISGSTSRRSRAAAKEDSARIEVVDKRTETPLKIDVPVEKTEKMAGDMQRTFPGEFVVQEMDGAGNPEVQAPGRGTEKGSSLPDSASLKTFLSEEGNAGIVRNARFVLNNGDSGEIRLRLKPESLGNVRIILSLEEDRIAGRIIVENEVAREAFKQDLQSLVDAFTAEGFSTGSLEVAVGNGGSGERNSEDRQKSNPAHVREIERHTVPLEYQYDGYVNLIV